MPARSFLSIDPRDLFSNVRTTSRLGAILQFPLVRAVVAVLFLLPVLAINTVVVLYVIEQFEEPMATHIDFIRMIITIPLLFFAYSLYCRLVERRKAFEIKWRGGGRQWLVGALVSAGLVTTCVAVISVLGSFEIVEYRSASVLVHNALVFGMGALLQEMVLLLILFRLTEELAGTWVALLLSLLVFGFVHIFNPNQTLGSVIFLVLSSLILVAPFILTRQIWLSWGFHAGWNFTQAGVFGMANSGVVFPGWMISKVTGPDWLTGGEIGIEGSYVALTVDLAIGILILIAAFRYGRFLKPGWKRNRIHS